jgi:drug/metabolite transporter (DMT)-like permease
MNAGGSVSPYVPLALAVVTVSFGAILVRLAHAPALAISFNRVFLASLLVAPFALGAALRSWPRLRPRERVALFVAGAALALHFATWIASLSLTSVAASVLLVNTAPVFTVAFSRVFLGETPPPIVFVAMALALVGAALIALDGGRTGADSLKGDLLALAGAATLSVYHVVGRGLRAALPLTAYVFGVWSTAAAVLALLAVPARVPLFGYPAVTFLVFVALALVPTLAGHGLVNVSLRLLPAPTVGLFLLGEPLGATVLALALFGEVPGALTLAGGAVVVAALALLVRSGAP